MFMQYIQIKKVKYLFLLVGLVIFCVVCALLYARNNSDKVPSDVMGVNVGMNQQRKITIEELGYEFLINTIFKEKNLPSTETGQDTKELFVAYKPAADIAESALVHVYFEEGLKAPSNLLGKKPTEVIFQNSERALKNKFPNYSLISKEITNLEKINSDVFQMVFSYAIDNEKVVQKLLGIPIDDDRVLYFRFQCAEDSYREFNSRYFEPLFESIESSDQ